ncbi:DUF4832 domain-containing protein [Haloarcula sp. S1CR25-12]|uniref:DUF4832 domain-containing protein n=1 Tax=Haloarcula saliterrae TaxID=2950534 RepID=A0ABU2F679_9EURY|nr:hypothetical protein [Haloarcula sp. S1CR25-12]MDS0257784.1 DUF4832 domain-containing protein [Haloarcula sp. S1CR25-12]
MHRRLSALALGLLCLVVVAAPVVGQSAAVAFSATGDDARAGGTATVTFTLENTADEDVSGIVTVTELPADWTVEGRTDDGGFWNDGERKWLFQTVTAGSTVTPSLTLSVPAGASGSYDVVATADDGDTVTRATATVAVGPATGASGEATATGQSTTGASGPGLGVAGAVVTLVVAVALLGRS